MPARAGNSGTGQEFHVSYLLDPGWWRRQRADAGKQRGGGMGDGAKAREREISALGISETSLARVTSRPFRRKFKFHRIEAVPACKRAGIHKRSFVCAPNEQTDGAWYRGIGGYTYVRMNDTSLDARAHATRQRTKSLRDPRREEVCAATRHDY